MALVAKILCRSPLNTPRQPIFRPLAQVRYGLGRGQGALPIGGFVKFTLHYAFDCLILLILLRLVNLLFEAAMRFWDNVVAILEERGKSMRSLAREVGVSAPAFTNYGRGGMPSLDVAVRIAKALDISLDALVSNEPGAPYPRPCPSAADHELLRDLVKELGLPDLMHLSKLGTNWATLQVIDVFNRRFPSPLSVEEIRASLPGMTNDVLKASLVALRRTGVIDGSGDEDGAPLRLNRNVPHLTARELGDYAQHVKRAVKILFGDVLPALERPVRTGHLLTFTGRLQREKAEQLAQELNELIKAKISASADQEAGDSDVQIVFGVAYQGDAC